ncbi:hypothetical protein ABZZ17_09535 [Streptomyces sp. NPDC006512]|uniref:hypothetical protein n=1 Tax=Streptomyces sp. NPDC006512 TaxID=3154307 RepID=UPI0033AAAA27
MPRIERTLATGAALIVLLAGCEAGGEADGNSPGSAIGVTPLKDLEPITVAGDPMADVPGSVTIVAETKFGHNRIIGYVNDDSCGLLTFSTDDPAANRAHLVSKWPGRGEGSTAPPAGPYHSVSGAAGAKAWVSLRCGQNAMVIEYVSDGPAAPHDVRGQATAAQLADNPATVLITIGDPTVRKQLEYWAKSPVRPTTSGPIR